MKLFPVLAVFLIPIVMQVQDLPENLLNKKEDEEILFSFNKIDSISESYDTNFSANSAKDYNRLKLLEEKEKLIASLLQKYKDFKMISLNIFILLITSVLCLLYYFKTQLLYKKRFEELIIKSNNCAATSNKPHNAYKNKIPEEVIKDVLCQLDIFETEKGFLSHDVSLQELAKSFKTNPRYLSGVVNLEKKKNFSNYINDLRVEFAFKKLAESNLFRKYSIKAIAHDIGFKTDASFSKAFFKKYGIFPSLYIKNLEKE